MMGSGMQKLAAVREFLALLANDDAFRSDLEQNPEIALKYLGVLGSNTPALSAGSSISLPPKEDVRRVLQQFDFALEHTGNHMELQGWGAWWVWVFAFVGKTQGREQLQN